MTYFLGRTLQLVSLLTLPSAIWVAEVQKSEAGAITIFIGAITLFLIGWLLARKG